MSTLGDTLYYSSTTWHHLAGNTTSTTTFFTQTGTGAASAAPSNTTIGLVLTVGTPGSDTLVPSEKAVRSAISIAASGVSTTGTTSTGSLVKFSGVNTITNTDLTGDVTTSSFSTTTLSTTGVTAGTYGSSTAIPIVTVDAKGRITAASTTSFSSTTSSSLIARVAFTTGVTVSGTTEATATSIVSAGSIAFDGTTPVLITFYTPFSQNSGSGAEIRYYLIEDGSSIGIIGIFRNVAAVNMQVPTTCLASITPSNASHTYEIKASRLVANGTVGAGVGGAGVTMPGFIQITRD